MNQTFIVKAHHDSSPRIRVYLLLAVLCISSFFNNAYTEEIDPEAVQALVDQVTPAMLIRLEAGEVISENTARDSGGGSRAARGTVFMIFDVTPEEAWPYLSDHMAYAAYMPHLLSVEEYETREPGQGVKQSLKIAWKKLKYHIVQQYDAEAYVVHWYLDPDKENDVKESRGYWKLIPHGEKQSIVIYSVDVDSGMRVPAFIENYMLRSDLPGVVLAMEKRIETKGEYKK